MGLPHCERSAAPLLFSSTVNLAPPEYEREYSNVFVLLQQKLGRVSRCVERIVTETNGVWCKTRQVLNNNGKNM